LQNILEHAEIKKIRDLNDYKLKPVNRNFESDFFSKYIYGNFGSNKHALHHWDPAIHFSCLDQVHNFLENSNLSDTIINHKARYIDTIKKIFN